MKSVFILGAGASKEAGAPLMMDFLDRAEDLLRKKSDSINEAKDDFEDVFKAISELQGVHSKSYLNLDNIEILFGAIEMGLLLKRLGTRDEESIINLRNSLITLIFKTLENSMPFPVQREKILPPKPYDVFFENLNKAKKKQSSKDPHHFSFITFNYDLCIDFSLHYSRWKYDYFLESEEKDNHTPLLKLHGSINWGLSKNKEIVPYHMKEAYFHPFQGDKDVFFDLGTNLHKIKHKNEPLSGPPVIVPPTWNKNSYHGQLTNVWSKAAYEIAEAQNIFIIGYSLPETDSFFKYLYSLGSESSTRLRNFIVINVDNSGLTEERFRNLIGRGIENRFQYIPSTFSEGLRNIWTTLNNP